MNIQQALAVLELPLSAFNIPRNIQPEIAVQRLEEFKTTIKSQRKKLVKKYHPDISTGNEEKMKLINNTIDELLKIQIRVRPPQPQFRTIVVNINFNSSSASDYGFSHTSTCGY